MSWTKTRDCASFAIRDALVFTGDEFLEKGTVVVRNGEIDAIIPDGAIALPANLRVVSLPGHTLIPGLIDAHVHGLEGNVECIAQSLRFGVTTVCDMHNDGRSLAKLKALAADPTTRSQYADFKCAGAGATIEGGWPAAVIELEYKDQPETAKAITSHLPQLRSAADAQTFVEAQITQHGASYIKLMHELGDTIDMQLPRPPLTIQKAVVATAHAHGMIAVGHAFSHAGAIDLLESGVDGLTHAFFDAPPSARWLQLMQQNQAHCNPTLACCASQTGHGAALQAAFFSDPLAARLLADPTPRQDLNFAANNPAASFDQAVQNVRAMHAAGIPLITGSDCAGKHLGTAYGLGVHVELHMLAHTIGLSPLEVLRSATALPADRFGFADRGRLAAGCRADLVLVEGDLRAGLKDPDVKCLPLRAVWRQGILCQVYAEADQAG